jgi:hypothetical protein
MCSKKASATCQDERKGSTKFTQHNEVLFNVHFQIGTLFLRKKNPVANIEVYRNSLKIIYKADKTNHAFNFLEWLTRHVNVLSVDT